MNAFAFLRIFYVFEIKSFDLKKIFITLKVS